MKTLLISLLGLMLLLVVAPVIPQTAFAACPSSNTPEGQVVRGIGETGGTCSGDGVTSIISTVITVISIIAGAVAIIMIIVSGFKYITSGGDSGKVASAKNTLIYALVGVAVAVLAQALVNFAFTTASNASSGNPCLSGYHKSSDGTCKKN